MKAVHCGCGGHDPLMPLYPEISRSMIFACKVEVGVLTMIQTCDNSAGSADGQSADPFDPFWIF